MGEKERWSQGLADDILQLIAQRLYISDYLVFRQVCPNWRAAVDRGLATRSCPPAPQLPWLLLHNFYGLWTSPGNQYSLDALYIERHQYSFRRAPTSFRSEIMSSPVSYSFRYCVGSIESWLIVAIYQRCRKNNSSTVVNFFFNPVSRARVMLPSKDSFLMKIVASSPPAPTTRLQQKQHNCFVAALSYGNRLGICRPTDTSWTVIETIDGLDYKDIEIIDQKLYVVCREKLRDNKYYVLEFDILSEDDNVTRAKYNCRLCIDIPNFSVLNSILYPCLAKDSASKELFIIRSRSLIRKGFRVYKMESKTDGEPSCKEATDLGDRTLFLSNKSNKVINDKTLGKNCIYFAYDLEGGFGVYSLADRSIKRVYFPTDYSFSSRETIWFTPHPW
ncbi:uncharacterized protein LOC133733553 [Rosa rugosa]|uniref:uncharacterized protein LOC133733553 n=1 Tax=Rosa rugosa TaxID=74645 RepID=UPI002B406CCA|nr:uncharacterized protein LOC133733553 [Rosa rugosa]